MAFGRANPPGLVYKIDLSKIADRANPRTVEAPINGYYTEDIFIDWGDGSSNTFAKSGTGQNNGEKFPTHTYAAAGVYHVVVRSVSGGMPLLTFNDTYGSSSEPQRNITYALISVDHFSGVCSVAVSRGGRFKRTYNLKFVDTRICGEPSMTQMPFMFLYSGISQRIESFCFNFCPYVKDCGSAFTGCIGLTGTIPPTFLDGCVSITTISGLFSGCTGLVGDGYVFWKSDGTLDTDKFPSLDNGSACYSGCSGLNLAQIPSTYGGTMTVS